MHAYVIVYYEFRSPRHAVRLAARKISLDLFHLNKDQRTAKHIPSVTLLMNRHSPVQKS